LNEGLGLAAGKADADDCKSLALFAGWLFSSGEYTTHSGAACKDEKHYL